MRPSKIILPAVAGLGSLVNTAVSSTGEAARLGAAAMWYGIKGLVVPKVYNRFDLVRQMELTGARSLPIVVLVSSLVGMTLVAQMIPTLETYGTKEVVSGVVGVSITRTLGPVLTAIVFTGRVGAAFTAELGTMKVSEEILALETMGINPVGYLIAPRLFAGFLMLMALTVIFDACALLSAYFIATIQFGIDPDDYIDIGRRFTNMWDFGYGVIKAAFFSVIITVVSCYKGFSVKGSGEDVGRATMESVVICLLAVIFADFALSLAYNVFVRLGWMG